MPFWVISLMAVVIANEVATVTGAFFSRASSFISSGCQSGAYFISKRVMVKSTGAPVLSGGGDDPARAVRASVTCSRPICVPLTKMPNAASPGAGAGGGELGGCRPRRGQHGGRRQGGTMKSH